MGIHTASISRQALTREITLHPTYVNALMELPNARAAVIRWEPISMAYVVAITANGRTVTQDIPDMQLKSHTVRETTITRVLHQMYSTLTKPLNKLIPPNT